MIESIVLREFQAHKHTKIEFHKGINAVTGLGSHGKSSIFRAINWVYSNTPRGDSVVNYDNRTKTGIKGETSATIVSNGHTIKRIKDAKRNGYDINGEELGAIGSGTPDKVRNALNLSDISFQSQHSSHFLLSQSSGEVATYLNTVLNLSVIDDVLGKANERLRAAKRKQEATNDEIAQLGTQISELDYIDDLVPLVEKLNKTDSLHKTTVAQKAALSDIITGIEGKEKSIQVQQKYIQALQPIVTQIDITINKQNVVSDEVDSLVFFIAKIKELHTIKERNSHRLQALPLCARTTTTMEKYANTQEVFMQLSRTIETIKITREFIITAEDKITSIQQKMPSTCPTCGAKL